LRSHIIQKTAKWPRRSKTSGQKEKKKKKKKKKNKRIDLESNLRTSVVSSERRARSFATTPRTISYGTRHARVAEKGGPPGPGKGQVKGNQNEGEKHMRKEIWSRTEGTHQEIRRDM